MNDLQTVNVVRSSAMLLQHARAAAVQSHAIVQEKQLLAYAKADAEKAQAALDKIVLDPALGLRLDLGIKCTCAAKSGVIGHAAFAGPGEKA